MAGAATAALAVSLAACGGEPSPKADEAGGTYPVKVVTAEFPTRQRLGQTSLMRIGVRNSGGKTVPALTVTVSIAGEAGQTASLPFAIHDPTPGLAQPDRPVWVLSARYPKLAGSSISAGAEGSSRKSFDFGALKPGATTEAVWKLSAVKSGQFTVVYEIGAGAGAGAETSGGVEPGGSFTARISEVPPDTIVTDSGEVVEIGKQQKGKRRPR